MYDNAMGTTNDAVPKPRPTLQKAAEGDPSSDQVEADSLPQVPLPGGCVRVTDTATTLGKLMGATGRYFSRGRALVAMRHNEDRNPVLEVVKPAHFQSAIEEVAQPVKRAQGKDTRLPTVCSRQSADAILHADGFVRNLPPIRCLTRCPVLIERKGHLVQVAGYDRESGVYAAGEKVPEISLDEAKERLGELLQDFRFVTPGDRSRALAALITAAMVFGGLLKKRAPATLVEANASQTGKGYFVKLVAAVYSDVPATVTQSRGGVGSLEESFDQAVIAGRAFLCLDNLRGNLNSPKLESFLTEDEYLARVPYSSPVQVDPRKTVLAVTSNRAELTRDFVNRTSLVRLEKQSADYSFKKYSEGDLGALVSRYR